MSDKAGSGRSRRVAPLDGLRGLAILLVMISHFLDLIDAPQSWFLWCRPGWFGVELFLLLSGFLITGILLDARQKSRYFLSFYGRRMLRIFPLYYGILLFLLVLLPLVWQPPAAVYQYLQANQIWYWTQLTNWLFAAHGTFDGVAAGYLWTLALEGQFYLVWPVVVWLLPPRALGWTCGLLALGSFALRLGFLMAGSSATTVYVMTITHLEPLAFGSLLALGVRSPLWAGVLPGAIVKAGLAAAGGLVLLGLWRRQLVFWDPPAVCLGITLLSIVSAGLLTASYRSAVGSRLYRWTSAPPLRSLAQASYAVYLFHLPVAAVCQSVILEHWRPWLGSGAHTILLYLAAAGLCSWAVGMLSWHLYERQFMKLKTYLTPGAIRQPAAPPRFEPAGRPSIAELSPVS